jgi:hypothetical protein
MPVRTHPILYRGVTEASKSLPSVASNQEGKYVCGERAYRRAIANVIERHANQIAGVLSCFDAWS